MSYKGSEVTKPITVEEPPLVTLTVDTTPVKGYVIIRENTESGPILAEGTAPVDASKNGTWIYYIQFGEVPGYTKPPDDSGMIASSKTLLYTYIPAAIETALTISAPDIVSVGVTFTVSGRLTRKDTGAGIGGQTIYLYCNASAWGPSPSPVTDVDGYYRGDGAIYYAGTYTLKASFLGTGGVAAAEATRGIGVTEEAATYIVYDSDLSDQRSAELIAEKKGYALLQTPETADPSVYSPQHDDNNIVCVGLFEANAYTKYYFPKLRYDSLYNPDNFPDNPEMWRIAGDFEITPDGKRIIRTIRRANGTTVTVVGGVAEADTWRAANDYCAPKMNLALGVAPWAAAAGISAVILRRG